MKIDLERFLALTAMLAAGLFEYNFGDSEFLMLFLCLVTLPFAARLAVSGTRGSRTSPAAPATRRDCGRRRVRRQRPARRLPRKGRR